MTHEITMTDGAKILVVRSHPGICTLSFQRGRSPSDSVVFDAEINIDEKSGVSYEIKYRDIFARIQFLTTAPDDVPALDGLEPTRKIGAVNIGVQNCRAQLPDGSWIGG